MEVANNILLYVSEIWDETMEVKKRANSLVLGALRIASPYRPVAAPAVFVIAGTIPVDLLSADGSAITGHFIENTITKWQRRWNDGDRGRWTARLSRT